MVTQILNNITICFPLTLQLLYFIFETHLLFLVLDYSHSQRLYLTYKVLIMLCVFLWEFLSNALWGLVWFKSTVFLIAVTARGLWFLRIFPRWLTINDFYHWVRRWHFFIHWWRLLSHYCRLCWFDFIFMLLSYWSSINYLF